MNDGEECDMTLMEELLKAFIDSDTIKYNLTQLCKCTLRRQRILWRFIRELQLCEYKRTGMVTLGRTAQVMVAETPMMKNLDCPEFRNIIFNEQPTLAARFAQLDIRLIQEEMTKVKDKEKLLKGQIKIINDGVTKCSRELLIYEKSSMNHLETYWKVIVSLVDVSK